MLDYERIKDLLTVQQQSYDLLKWLADTVNWQPRLLVPEEAALLHKPESARQWLNKHKTIIPTHLVPDSFEDSFCNLFASFFSTSFRVGHFEFDGKLLETSIKVGPNQAKASIIKPAQCELLALRHLCNSENIRLTDKEAKTLVRRKTLNEALLVWTYVWELDRRAKAKGKGAVVHQIWKSIPRETRKSLDGDKVWSCREQILVAASAHIAQLQE